MKATTFILTVFLACLPALSLTADGEELECFEDEEVTTASVSLLQTNLHLLRRPWESSSTHSEEEDLAAASVSLLQTHMHLSRHSPESRPTHNWFEGSPSMASKEAVPSRPQQLAATPAISFSALETDAVNQLAERKLLHAVADAADAAWGMALQRTESQGVRFSIIMIVAVGLTLGMVSWHMKAEGKGRTIFQIVAHPVEASAFKFSDKAKKNLSPPWESTGPCEYIRKEPSELKAGSRPGAPASKCVPLPRLCPGWEESSELIDDYAIIDMDALSKLTKCPVDIKNSSGKKVLEAAVRSSGDGLQVLELSIVGQAGGPHATIHGVGGSADHSGVNMEIFGHGASQPYFNLVAQVGGGSRLHRAGKLVMTMQSGFEQDFRMMALNADGDFLASGGRYLGVRRRPGDVWKMRLCGDVDPLLIISCMLATLSTRQTSPSVEMKEEYAPNQASNIEANAGPTSAESFQMCSGSDSDSDQEEPHGYHQLCNFSSRAA